MTRGERLLLDLAWRVIALCAANFQKTQHGTRGREIIALFSAPAPQNWNTLWPRKKDDDNKKAIGALLHSAFNVLSTTQKLYAPELVTCLLNLSVRLSLICCLINNWLLFITDHVFLYDCQHNGMCTVNKLRQQNFYWERVSNNNQRHKTLFF